MNKNERLDKMLAHMGVGTRSEIKKLARQGFITLNGSAVKDTGIKVDPAEDEIRVNGEPIVYRKYIYLMLNKPQGVVSATEDNRDQTVIDLLEEQYRKFEPFPVGRLDKDTEGLLILTNDGQLAHRLLSPRRHVPKTYWAEVEGQVGEADRESFRRGVALDDGYVTMPAKLDILNAPADGQPIMQSYIHLTIMEGKFHQVKRMFLAVGKKVVRLKRLSMGPLPLDESLEPGQYRELTEAELELLLEAKGQ